MPIRFHDDEVSKTAVLKWINRNALEIQDPNIQSFFHSYRCFQLGLHNMMILWWQYEDENKFKKLTLINLRISWQLAGASSDRPNVVNTWCMYYIHSSMWQVECLHAKCECMVSVYKRIFLLISLFVGVYCACSHYYDDKNSTLVSTHFSWQWT